ncbi:uncharacterized protein LOC142353564 isoform X3 [Convolutriloba macropyga]|uniref:uncharacterized protein LOC142353564 isoform X3 n=1 Tax=Convolutriloba macropyga TaxID=536237 RepID=UPI003F528BC7
MKLFTTLVIISIIRSSLATKFIKYREIRLKDTNHTYMYCDSCQSSFYKAPATCSICSNLISSLHVDDVRGALDIAANQIWRFIYPQHLGEDFVCYYTFSSSECFNGTGTPLQLRNPLFAASDPCFTSDFSEDKATQLAFVCEAGRRSENLTECPIREYCQDTNPMDAITDNTCPLILKAGISLLLQPFYWAENNQRSSCKNSPWLVRIQAGYGQQGYQVCAGAILNQYAILTARHCVDYQADRLTLYFGEESIKNQIKNEKADNTERFMVMLNTQLYKMSEEDVAIVVTKRAIYNQTSSKIAPATLPDRNQRPRRGDRARVAGWGATCVKGEKVDGEECMHQRMAVTLLEVRVTIVDSYGKWYDAGNKQSQCPYNSKMTQRSFCAGGFIDGYRDSCRGDSGSPLICYDSVNDTEYVCGIVSFGAEVCGSSPGGYINITNPKVRNFINDSMTDLREKIRNNYFEPIVTTKSLSTTLHLVYKIIYFRLTVFVFTLNYLHN